MSVQQQKPKVVVVRQQQKPIMNFTQAESKLLSKSKDFLEKMKQSNQELKKVCLLCFLIIQK